MCGISRPARPTSRGRRSDYGAVVAFYAGLGRRVRTRRSYGGRLRICAVMAIFTPNSERGLRASGQFAGAPRSQLTGSVQRGPLNGVVAAQRKQLQALSGRIDDQKTP